MKPTDLNSSQTKSSASEHFAPSESVERARNHYQAEFRAKRFASRAISLATDLREKKCVAKAWNLVNAARGVSVLDIPCGAGRMLPLLKKWGFKVIGADVSASMVEEARHYAGPEGKNCLDDNDQLVVTDVFQTGFENKQFDAVMCHRLFQYFNKPQDRRMALEELHRISKGPLIVSFSCNWSLDFVGYKIRRLLGITRKRSCEPISVTTFAKDIRACGLKVERWIAMRPFISKRWYAVLKPATASCTLADAVCAYKNILWAAIARLIAVTAAILIGVFAIN
jgi:SAM-dependent methyltransferase